MGFSDLIVATKEELDAAKRLSDIVNNICVFQPLDVVINSWIAVKLSDGSYDGTLYDSRADAVRHQYDETQCAYVCLRSAPGGMELQAAYAFLKFHRHAYDAGFKLTDPDAHNGGRDMMLPIEMEAVKGHVLRMSKRRVRRR